MKRYDSITAIKAIACMIVFFSHWNGAFASWGHKSLDWFFLKSPFRMLTFGNMAVCIFLMLSGTLVSLKIFRGSPFDWGEELLKRYVRMAVPIFGTHLLVYLAFRLHFFYTGQAAALMGNEWLSFYYRYDLPISLKTVFCNSFITSVFLGDSSYYGPLWMMNYIFFGTIFSVVLAAGVKEMTTKGKRLLFLALFAIFLVLDSYYCCFLFGNVLALLLLWLEQQSKTGWNVQKKVLVCLGSVLLFLFGVWLGLTSFFIANRLQSAGIGAALGNASFWGLVSGFLMSLGLIVLWELLDEPEKKQRIGRAVWQRPILWLGERSYSVFLVHWLVICTFSCAFYSRFVTEKPNWFYLGVNFFATALVMLAGTEIFYQLVEKRLFAGSLRLLKRLFFPAKQRGGIGNETIGGTVSGASVGSLSDDCGGIHGDHQFGGNFESAEGNGAFFDGYSRRI